MAVVVEFDFAGRTVVATVDNAEWTCDEPVLLAEIEDATLDYEGSGEVAHPDLGLAEYVIEDLYTFKGRVTHADPAPPFNKGVWWGKVGRNQPDDGEEEYDDDDDADDDEEKDESQTV